MISGVTLAAWRQERRHGGGIYNLQRDSHAWGFVGDNTWLAVMAEAVRCGGYIEVVKAPSVITTTATGNGRRSLSIWNGTARKYVLDNSAGEWRHLR
jgi:hypothetical protein